LTHKQRHKVSSKYTFLKQTARRPRSVTKKKQIYKHHIFGPAAGTRCSISSNFTWW